jgi:hypothetical protein
MVLPDCPARPAKGFAKPKLARRDTNRRTNREKFNDNDELESEGKCSVF